MEEACSNMDAGKQIRRGEFALSHVMKEICARKARSLDGALGPDEATYFNSINVLSLAMQIKI